MIVEDNIELQNEVKDLLCVEGYKVFCAHNRALALNILRFQKIDLCLLDVQLPDCSGYELCKEIRTFNKNPIIMLTVCSEENDIIRGLQNGADDYVTKPFSIKVLLTRIETQLRRMKWQKIEDYQIVFSGDLVINFDTRKIFSNNVEVPLRSIEFSICEILLRNRGRIVSRDLFFERLWDSKNNFVEDNTLTVHISRLRRALKTYQGISYIETVKNYGYRWNVDVKKS